MFELAIHLSLELGTTTPIDYQFNRADTILQIRTVRRYYLYRRCSIIDGLSTL
jgi:hypothetical protein